MLQFNHVVEGPERTLEPTYITLDLDLGIVLNTRLNVEDNVVSAAIKARRMLFYLKPSFAALTPVFFSPFHNFYPVAS